MVCKRVSVARKAKSNADLSLELVVSLVRDERERFNRQAAQMGGGEVYWSRYWSR